ncbi:unnamed protein product [Rangifer tarandus platyrhynchus]|uniref:Uncharacterized protein n=2 Tax=Rangifer tarandus platyrhynchus TaxID=3082113 RepID=A0ABN8ZJ85_RANTA|nr:unnamed protein product [Rangifer tarandus platyrhynchus]CAI9707694.1 unnamed protein product [Rangifer tarandus platyrhynchus]
MFFSVLERERTIMQRPGRLLFLNSLERCGARGRGLRGHSWARMLLPILLAQFLRREFDVQYSSGCGWSGAVLLAPWESGNLSPGGPVGKNGSSELGRSLSAMRRNTEQGRIAEFPREGPAPRTRGGLALGPRGPASSLPWMPRTLRSSSTADPPGALPAQFSAFTPRDPSFLSLRPLPTRFRSPLPHLAPAAL